MSILILKKLASGKVIELKGLAKRAFLKGELTLPQAFKEMDRLKKVKPFVEKVRKGIERAEELRKGLRFRKE